ncbi:molybdopterin molybdotransferase MoeA [Tropicibacter oceani]|uniref:Molybdopterin molybdenumtransferase n=1 Tax=Tropicibacter oceani TaxID=3058420 RepID=A0ABY8QGJ5_9RHOB|nr:gephyrin-like molybdotransferase Glp [Tropicibacter oceani]WGW03639.1 molybdopterin molybdotransferase MoeA [Tropicibacter oceani]
MKMTSVNSANDCGCGQAQGGAWTLDAALRAVAAMTAPLSQVEDVPLARAAGRVLATPVIARAPLPRFDHAAMDGYALRHADLTGPGPWSLPVDQRIAAGQAPEALAAGRAARIFTGAPLPDGADTVIMQEHAHVSDGILHLDRLPQPGTHIRRQGEETAKGAVLLEAGQRLGARHIAVAACAGAQSVTVRRPVRVVLLATGDELCDPGQTPGPGLIVDVNTPMLTAALTRADVTLLRACHVPDSRADHVQALAKAARDADLIVTTGGVSVGEEDHMRAAVLALGGQIDIPAVAIKPGKPVTLGRLGAAHWLGLPGNPMSAFVTFMLFGLPLLSALSGSALPTARRTGVLTHDIARRLGRCEIRPACIDGQDAMGRLQLTVSQGIHSGRMTPLARADGCVVLPASGEPLCQGTQIDFLQFPEGF